jgi:hypothetical protein
MIRPRTAARRRASILSFQPRGMRRLIGFQAVTKAARRPRSSPSIAALRRPMRTTTPAASYSVRK